MPSSAQSKLRTSVLGVEKSALWVSGVFLVVMGILTIWSVVQRYLVAVPIAWNIGFIGSHLMMGFLCFGLAHTARVREHVSIDSVYLKLNGKYRKLVNLVADTVSLAVTGLFLWASASKFGNSWATQSSPPPGGSELALPDWTADLIAPVAFLILLITLVTRIVAPEDSARQSVSEGAL